MRELLFINACVRGERSRTLRLARRFLTCYQTSHPQVLITERNLCIDRLQPQYPEVLEERDALWRAGRFDHPMFDAAHQFARAHRIVIAAPFWDLSYPAVLKIYLERISVADITFGYGPHGELNGLCRAEKLLLVTTRGGEFSHGPAEALEMGARHLKALCQMYGISTFQLLCAEGLDDIRKDRETLLRQAEARGEEMAALF